MQSLAMDLEPYDLRDPQQLLDDVCRTNDLVEGDLLIVLVEDPSVRQNLIDVRRLEARDWQDLDQLMRSDMLRRVAESLPLDVHKQGAPHHLLLTILVRRGLTVIDGRDAEVLEGWRYANHLMPTFDGGLLVVTEHGWHDWLTGCAGHTPALGA
jgi:hypothetical protein